MTVPREIEDRYRSRFSEYLRTLDCVHCGLCLPQCPTYRSTARESDSPRGRIYLMRGYAEGQIELTAEARRHLDLCIVCRNCESVCPSGIRMGEMMESFRDGIRRRDPGMGPRDILLRFALRKILPHRKRIAILTDLLYLFERSGLRKAWRSLGTRISPRLAEMEGLLPPMPSPTLRGIDAEAASAGGLFRAEGKARIRVALFLGCISGEWYASAHRATIRVLTKNGCDVLVPFAQTCCGALHRHAGYLEEAARLFEANARAFGALKIDAVVVNAAGCGAALKEPPRLESIPVGAPHPPSRGNPGEGGCARSAGPGPTFGGCPGDTAESIVEGRSERGDRGQPGPEVRGPGSAPSPGILRVGAGTGEGPGGGPRGLGVPIRDICELLDEIGIIPPTRAVPRVVAQHQPCHLVHAQKIGPQPVENLLRKIPGLTLVPLADSDQCCGAGGVYNLLQPAMARDVLAAKVEAILKTGAEVLVTGNPGCWLQIRWGLEGKGIEVLHPVELLDRAYSEGPD